jgi:hypothetical protein
MQQQGEEAQMSLANRLTTALAKYCCRDGRVNQGSLRPNITTPPPGAVSCRARGSRHSDLFAHRDLEAASRGRPTCLFCELRKNQVRYQWRK